MPLPQMPLINVLLIITAVSRTRRKLEMKKVLLLGSSFSAVPMLLTLKKLGYSVAVCGNLPNDPCHLYADKSFLVDYSSYNDVELIIENERFDFIVPTCNDEGYFVGSRLAEKYGFPGFDSYSNTEAIHIKSRFREVLDSLGLPSPKARKQPSHGYDIN